MKTLYSISFVTSTKLEWKKIVPGTPQHNGVAKHRNIIRILTENSPSMSPIAW